LGFRARHAAVDQVESDVARELERRLAPEFRNRIDDVILFTPLSTDDVRTIARGYLSQIERAAAKAGKTVHVDDDVVEMLAAEGYNPAFGARFLKRVIDERVKVPLSMHWKDATHFRVRVADQEIAVETRSVRLAA